MSHHPDHFSDETEPTASITAFRFMDDALRSRGIDPGMIYRAMGYQEDFLEDPDRRVPVHVFRHYWDAIVQSSDESAIGARLADEASIASINAPMLLLQSSDTFGEGVRRYILYRQIVDPLYDLSLEVKGDRAIFYFDLKHTMIPQRMECLAVFFCRFFSIATQGQWQPENILLRHDAPQRLADLQQIFGCSVEFACDRYAIIFDATLLSLTLHTRSAILCSHHEQLAELQLEQVAGSGFLSRIRQALMAILETGEISVERAAEHMALPPSVLQQRLRDLGVVFPELVDEVRKETATRLVSDSDDALVDIAYVVGYSALPNFYRAFKRWHGVTPVVYRKNAASNEQ